MNNMKHTPEPWSLHESYHAKPNSVPITTNVPTSEDGPEFTSWECVIASGDCIVSQVTGWDSPSGGFPRANNPEEVVANAQRIIACVNACAGINPEAVPDLMRSLEWLLDTVDYLAIRGIAVNEARAAIAKAKATEP